MSDQLHVSPVDEVRPATEVAVATRLRAPSNTDTQGAVEAGLPTTWNETISSAQLLRPVFVGWNRAVNLFGISIWLAAMAYFWIWWFQPDHIASVGRYALLTVVLAWITVVPAYFILIFASAKVPRAPKEGMQRARVAMVVTKAPAEPFSVVRTTLKGMLAQKGFEHDTWLADEAPDEQTLDWCARHGVKISSRRGDTDYQREDWPRRKQCKEGNLAYFYDHFGYRDYDFVAQFDADHIPSPNYLKHALQPFADPSVGYVSAPSICDSNSATSWSARSRLYVEASMHGPLQAGYNSGWAPLCIGSHYTVRCAALQMIGGLGPELAEDHSTTLMMNSGGWKGVHAIDAIAHGEGPETFVDLVVQEFQWSRTLVTILLKYSPSCLAKLSGRKRFQFLFSQLWYPTFSFMMALMFVLPIYALLTGRNYVNVTYAGHFVHFAPLSLVLLVLAYWWRSTGLFRPHDAKIISWEGIAFLLLRWPWALFGSLAAAWDWATSNVAVFRITPKGSNHKDHLPLRVVLPYLLLAGVPAMTALLVENPGSAGGFYIFTLVSAATYTILTVLVLARHAIENGLPLVGSDGAGVIVATLLTAISLTIGAATYENGAKGLAAIDVGNPIFTLTETVFSVAGAGAGSPGKPIIRIRPRWHGFGAFLNTSQMKVNGHGE